MPAPTYRHRVTGEQRTPVEGGASHTQLDADPDWAADNADPDWAAGNAEPEPPIDSDADTGDGEETP